MDEIIEKKFDQLEDRLKKQSHTIAILSVRVAALEKMLLDKGLVTEEDLQNATRELSQEFAKRAQELVDQSSKSE